MANKPYLVQLPSPDAAPARVLINHKDSVVVWAADATDAKAVAKAAFSGDANAQWNDATVTEIKAVGDFSAFTIHVAIKGATQETSVDVSTVPTVTLAALNAAGTGFAANDIITDATAGVVRPATIKVLTVSTGAIATFAIVDPGDYTGKATAVGAAFSGGTGTGATFDLTVSNGTFAGLLSSAVTALNALSNLAHTAMAVNASTFTVAGTADGLGDKTFDMEVRLNGIAIPSLIGAHTEGGSAGAALVAAIPSYIADLPTIIDTVRTYL